MPKRSDQELDTLNFMGLSDTATDHEIPGVQPGSSPADIRSGLPAKIREDYGYKAAHRDANSKLLARTQAAFDLVHAAYGRLK